MHGVEGSCSWLPSTVHCTASEQASLTDDAALPSSCPARHSIFGAGAALAPGSSLGPWILTCWGGRY